VFAFIGRNISMRRFDRVSRLGLSLGAGAIVLGSAIAVWHGAAVPPAAGDEGAK
jgi:hypothetical protein